MAKQNTSFSKKIIYELKDCHRGIIEVDGLLFAPDAGEYKKAEREIFEDPQYSACAEEQRKFMRIKENEQDALAHIIEETGPASMCELSRLRQNIPLMENHLEKTEKEVAEKIRVFKDAIGKETAQLTTYPQDSPEFIELKKKITDEKQNFNRIKRRYQEQALYDKRRIAAMQSRKIVLEEEKERLIKEKQTTLDHSRTSICAIGQRKKYIIHKIAGDLIEVPRKVLQMLIEDPDVSPETESAILEMMKSHKFIPNFWEIDSADLRDGTLPLISLCIEDDPEQTMADLIVRVAMVRNCQFIEAMPPLLKLRNEGRLATLKHHADGTESITPWTPRPSHAPRTKAIPHKRFDAIEAQ